MNEYFASLANTLEELTGIKGALGYIIIFICAMVGNAAFHHITTPHPDPPSTTADDEDEEPDPPRNFTLKQLRHFDGTHDKRMKEDKPVYLSLQGEVFDVTKGRDFYGPGGPYAVFAGRECGVALAKMSFDEQHLDDIAGCADLNYGETDSLQGWIQQFKYMKDYPVLGRLVPEDKIPSADRILTKEEIAPFNGRGSDDSTSAETSEPSSDIPEGYATAPIYIAAGGKVYDVSFGGVTFYGKNCSYNRFAGADASRALAKMSFDPQDVEDPDCSNLTEKEQQTLNDWIKTFHERKGYPIVGILE